MEDLLTGQNPYHGCWTPLKICLSFYCILLAVFILLSNSFHFVSLKMVVFSWLWVALPVRRMYVHICIQHPFFFPVSGNRGCISVSSQRAVFLLPLYRSIPCLCLLLDSGGVVCAALLSWRRRTVLFSPPRQWISPAVGSMDSVYLF